MAINDDDDDDILICNIAVYVHFQNNKSTTKSVYNVIIYILNNILHT